MKALVKAKREKGIWLQDVEVPGLKAHEVRIKIKKTAICGTDIHIYSWDDWAQKTIPVPMVAGHEFSGIVDQVGSEVQVVSPGDRVSGEGHITCGHCRNCRGGFRHLCRNTLGVGVNRSGCFAEYLVIPQENVFPLPKDVSDEIASILDPFGNATHAALSFDLVGEDILIMGAGPIGLMASAICRHVGARHVVIADVNDYRLGLADRMGATRSVNVQKESLQMAMAELGMREGFDVGLEMSGSGQAFQNMIESMNYGGRISLLGIPEKNTVIDWNLVVFKSLKIKGIYGREMFETWYKMTAMLQSGLDLGPIITHRFGIDDFQQGFDVMVSGKSGKVLFDWN